MPRNKLERAQEEFCFRYALLGDVEEAAVQSGFDRSAALQDGIRCLKMRSCQRRIKLLRSQLSENCCVMTGLRRLAFGSAKDAALLAFSEELPDSAQLDRLDLFNVSEIKRDKGGGVEIKLFDRLKALEKLYELESALADRDRAEKVMGALLRPQKEDDDG